MSEQRPLLPLTPTERRIAEMAFASASKARDGLEAAAHATCAVWWLRNPVRDPSSDTDAFMADAASMLAELRHEPVDSALMHAKALADERDRYRTLLERIVAGITPEDAAELSELTVAEAAPTEDREKCERFLGMLAAIADARKELGR